MIIPYKVVNRLFTTIRVRGIVPEKSEGYNYSNHTSEVSFITTKKVVTFYNYYPNNNIKTF